MKHALLFLVTALILIGSVYADDSRFGVFGVQSDICVADFHELIIQQYGSNDNSKSGSGGWCEPEWKCSDWTSCNSQGYQTRECFDTWKCKSILKVPEVYRECSQDSDKNTNIVEFVTEPDQIVPPQNKDTNKNQADYNKLTGAVTGGGEGSWIWLGIIGLILAALLILFFANKK